MTLVREVVRRVVSEYMIAAVAVMFSATVLVGVAVWPRQQDVRLKSTTNVDDLDIAGTTAAHGLVTLSSGITGLPTSSCAAGQAITAFGTTGSGACTALSASRAIDLEGTLTDGFINNWAPASLATSDVIQVTAADNPGSVITGIDAIGAGFAVGKRLTLCNANGPQDDAILSLAPENSGSTANNRIWTPAYGKDTSQTATDRYLIGPSSCIDLLYMTPNQADLTVKRWIVVDNTRFGSAVINQLGIYPSSNPAAITGTVNDWDPDDSSFGAGLGEGGVNTISTARTLIRISTVDGTGATISGVKYTGSQNADGQGPIKILCNTGPGPVTLKNYTGGSSGENLMLLSAAGDSRGDIVLQAGDPCITLWHKRDVGSWVAFGKNDYFFGSRDVNMTAGLVVSTPSTSIEAASFTGPAASSTAPVVTVSGHNTDGTADTLRVRSGDSASYAAISVGRSSLEATWGIAAGANDYITGSAAGDAIFSVNGGSRKIFLGAGGTTPNLIINTSDLSSELKGHIRNSGASVDSGQLTSCGTGSPTMAAGSTDMMGSFTEGTAATGCTMTFAATYTTAPFCVCSAETAGGAAVLVGCHTTATTLVAVNASAGGDVVTYNCVGR